MIRRVAGVAMIALALLAGACRKNQQTASLKAQNKVAMRQVKLFFESPDLLLVGETRNVELPESPAGAISATVRELFKGSANPSVPHPFPDDTIVRGAYLLPGGLALVDLGGKTLSEGWGTGSHEELMAVYSIVQTITANFPQARRVRLLINGEPAETLAGHVSLAGSLSPMASLVDSR